MTIRRSQREARARAERPEWGPLRSPGGGVPRTRRPAGGGRRRGGKASAAARVGIPPEAVLLAVLYWGVAIAAGRPERLAGGPAAAGR
jgi:hypothetical protein